MEVSSPCQNQDGHGDRKYLQVPASIWLYQHDAGLFCRGRACGFAGAGHAVLHVAEHAVLHAAAGNAARASGAAAAVLLPAGAGSTIFSFRLDVF